MRAIICLSGLPRPEVNIRVYDRRGRCVARVDALYRRSREVLEYQGDQHRTDRAQWRRDISRRADLEALGYHVTDVTEYDLRHPTRFVTRTAAVLRQRGWEGTLEFSRWFPRDPTA